jgi:hypothetical protein
MFGSSFLRATVDECTTLTDTGSTFFEGKLHFQIKYNNHHNSLVCLENNLHIKVSELVKGRFKCKCQKTEILKKKKEKYVFCFQRQPRINRHSYDQ